MNESNPSPDKIAQRAYRSWEREGRPEGRALEHWTQAEKELRRGDPSGQDTGKSSSGGAGGGVRVSELDRALPPGERQAARAARQGKTASKARGGTTAPPPHFVIALDRAHLRIFRVCDTSGPSRESLQLEQSIDLPAGKAHYTDAESDQAGRFPGSFTSRGAPPDVGTEAGGSIDERLPLQEEQERRLVAQLAAHVDEFLRQHPEARWDYAAAPALHRAVLEKISDPARGRLQITVAKDLVNQPTEELAAQLARAQKEKD